jgi:AbrB family looped-hinge helix DNA binding protein
MRASSRITVKGQVTVPKKIRDDLKISPGDVILFVKRGDEVVIKPVKTLLDFKGVIQSDQKIDDWEKVRNKAKEYVAQKVVESLK